jgi:hypothetical protein
MAKKSFHIQHNTDIRAVQAALSLATPASPLDLYDFAERIGFSDSVAAKLVLPFLRQIGLLGKGGDLAPFGHRMAGLWDERPEMLGEAVHARLYALHLARPEAHFSFAYATLCDWLTDRGEFVMDGDGQAELVGVVVRKSAEMLGFDPAGIAFSKSSIQGAMHWLEVTDPPALADGMFRRRHAAPALAVLWAVDTLYRARRISFGTRLSPGRPGVCADGDGTYGGLKQGERRPVAYPRDRGWLRALASDEQYLSGGCACPRKSGRRPDGAAVRLP